MSPIRRLIPAVAAGLLLGAGAALAAPTAPSATDLTKAPEIQDVSVSPDGKHLVALTSPDGETTYLSIWSTDALAAKPVSIHMTKMRFQSVQFLKNDRLLVTAIQPVTIEGTPQHIQKTYVTNLTGNSFDPLLPDGSGGTGLATSPDYYRIISTLPRDPKDVLVEDDSRDGDIYSVDVYALTAGRIMKGSEKYFGYQADLKGELRARQFADFDNGALYIAQQVLDPDTNQWVELFRSYAKDRKPVTIIGFTPDPHVILISSAEGGDKLGIYEYDIKQKKVLEPAFEHKLFDVGSEIFTPQAIQSRDKDHFGDPLGFTLLDQSYSKYWTDGRMQGIQAAVAKALGERMIAVDWTDPGTGLRATIEVPDGASVQLDSWSDDLNYVIVEKSGPTQPPEYYLLSTVGGATKLALLGKARPWIDPATLGQMRLVEYPARDGLLIPAFLTLPPAQFGAGPFPTLIEPHGGPWARDLMDWDVTGWVQYFASRGYAVLQPQFRGSDGWGQKLWRAGDAEWGQKMQDDNDDAVKWLIDGKIANPKRVAIFGYSYGGYAALAATIRPNGLYQCAISGAGAGDLDKFASETYDNRYEREFQMPTVKGLDPMAHAQDAQIPVLLYHGDHDTRVFPEESRKFSAALKAAGKPYRYVEIKDMGHTTNTWTPDMAAEQLNIIDDFLHTGCKPGGL